MVGVASGRWALGEIQGGLGWCFWVMVIAVAAWEACEPVTLRDIRGPPVLVLHCTVALATSCTCTGAHIPKVLILVVGRR